MSILLSVLPEAYDDNNSEMSEDSCDGGIEAPKSDKEQCDRKLYR